LPKRLLPLIQTLVPLPACLPGTIFGRLISSLLAEADLARLLLNIWFRSTNRSERILVLEAGPFLRFHNVTNTYVAGPALFPTTGSPNPMLTGIALVRRLGDHLMPEPPLVVSEPGFTYLFEGSGAQFAKWEMAGGGACSRFGRTIIAQQNEKGMGLLFYKPKPFEDFTLRLDFLLPHPRGNNNDNSGIFVRFRDPRLPDPAPDSVDPADNAAFVAVHTGFEIQIDEEARGDRRFSEPNSSFFGRTGAIYKIKSLGTGEGQQNY